MPTAADVLADPECLAHRHVEGADAIRFVHVRRAEHRSMPFLTDAYLGSRPVVAEIPLDRCLAAAPVPAPHFLFHSAFCNSTLLARALDRPGLAAVLSEPVLLNDVVGFRQRGADSTAVARLADAATRLLGRPYAQGERVVIKPSNVINPYANLLLALRADARALFLYAPLETFLVSVARKGLECRLWVRELLAGLLRDGAVDLGMTMEDHFRQTDLQVAAVGWLAQHKLISALAHRLGAARLSSLDADRFTASPAEGLRAVAAHYRLALDEGSIAAIIDGPTFTRHSKSGAPYSAEARAADYAAVRAAHGDEIDMVVTWAGAVAKSVGIDLIGPNPLI